MHRTWRLRVTNLSHPTFLTVGEVVMAIVVAVTYLPGAEVVEHVA